MTFLHILTSIICAQDSYVLGMKIFTLVLLVMLTLRPTLVQCLKQVKNFISLGGPHAGIASVPLCGVSFFFFFPLNLFLFPFHLFAIISCNLKLDCIVGEPLCNKDILAYRRHFCVIFQASRPIAYYLTKSIYPFQSLL